VREQNCSVTKLIVEPNQLIVFWADGHVSHFNRFWLRDNCPSGGDKMTAIRSFTLREMDQHTAILNAKLRGSNILEISWKDDQHVSRFNVVWLREHCYEQSSRTRRQQRPILWNSDINSHIPTIDFSTLEVGNEQNLRLLKNLVNYGVARVINLPSTPSGINALEPSLAPFSENDFGKIFDLISEPDVWDLSQSNEALDPHSDDPYRYAPPGIRVLFCVEASNLGGGKSEIVNGIAAGEKMRLENPHGFKLLAETPIPYIRYREDAVPQGGDVHLRSRAPVLSVTPAGDVEGIRFHERSMATFDLPKEIVDDYYQALIELSKIINSGDFSIQYQLQPGEAFVFDNQQVLHGRTAFTGVSGRRHLTLCQMDRDLVHSRYRLLLSQHGHLGAAHTIANGV
jgi:alpha-ketoglutarate-dependent taurine dioxygenase